MTALKQYFSLKDNLKKLFHSDQVSHLSVIDGFRAIAILWVVGFHLLLYVGNIDIPTFLDIRNDVAVRWLRWGFHGVDIFFVISGFIIAHALIREWGKTGAIHIRHFYVRRILRLLPAYYVALALYALVDASALPYVWANILYINNMLPAEHQYMPWSWSLAIEEQFYIFFPLLLAALLKRPHGRVAAMLVLLAAAFVIRFYIALTHEIRIPPPHPFMDFAAFSEFYETLYAGLHVRFGALATGVIVALLYHFTSSKAFLEKHTIVRIFLLALSLFLLVPAIMADESSVIENQMVFSLVFASYPYLFAMAIGYLLFYCLTDHGNNSLLGGFMRWHPWYPIAQLSYSIYLVHPIVILIFYQQFFNPQMQPLATIMTHWLVAIPLIFAASAMLYLLVERPIMNARKKYQEV